MTTTTLLTTEQVAALVGKTVSTVNRWAVAGKITPALELPGVTGDRLYEPEAVKALIPEES